jgi:hypothetical protein
MSVGRGCAPEQHSFSSPDDGEASTMGLGRGCTHERHSFLSPNDGEASAMGVGPGRNDGEGSAMDVGLGCMPESDSLFLLRDRANDTQANIIHNLSLNLNYDFQREVIIKLVSNSKI